MNISFNWLKTYLEKPIELQQACNILTETGLEVDSITPIYKASNKFEGLVVGHVISCEQHPNADRLKITQVTTGSETLQIVCGAPNVANGQKVVVATVGTQLHPTNGEPFVIKKTKIRGESSVGMLCAGDEIGLDNNHDGIIVLPNETPIGIAVNQVLTKEPADYRIEIGLTPNRTDAFCHLGVARDIAAVTQQKLLKPIVSDNTYIEKAMPIQVQLKAQSACTRYTAIVLDQITIKPSPAWLQERLKAIGLNPINNVVDATNFVMHECGHPLHAFDADKILDNTIIVRFAHAGESIQLLDGKQYQLQPSNLIIADAQKPIALAGVMGGLSDSINPNTKRIFIESAYFAPAVIRQSAKIAGYKTDASFRYERGTDPNATTYALRRVIDILQQTASANVASNEIDVQTQAFSPIKLHFSYTFCDKVIGKKIKREQIKQILLALDFEILYDYAEGLEITIPTYRTDVNRPIDVVEEILRIYGLNQIPTNGALSYKKGYPLRNSEDQLKNQITDSLIANGFTEVMCNSFIQQKHAALIPEFASKLIKPMNPLNDELNCLRPHLIFGGLETIAHNINRKNNDLLLFEWGKAYQKKQEHYTETPYLALFATGNTHTTNWLQAKGHNPFWVLSAQLSHLLSRCGITKPDLVPLNSFVLADGVDYTHNQKQIARIGKVKSQLCNAFDIKQDVYYAQIDWHKLYFYAQKMLFKHQDLPKYPAVKRDLALLLPKETTFEALNKIIDQIQNPLIKQVQLFDVYEGDKLPSGFKSYAISILLQATDKTLTDLETETVIQNLIANFERALGATIRQ